MTLEAGHQALGFLRRLDLMWAEVPARVADVNQLLTEPDGIHTHRDPRDGFIRPIEIFINSKDLTKAVYWMEKAAIQGLISAQGIVGISYLFGHGVEKDRAMAKYWIGLARKNGHELSKNG